MLSVITLVVILCVIMLSIIVLIALNRTQFVNYGQKKFYNIGPRLSNAISASMAAPNLTNGRRDFSIGTSSSVHAG